MKPEGLGGIALRLASALAAAALLPALVSSSPAAAAGWSGPAQIDTPIATTSLSCPSSSFCVAVGFASSIGTAAVYRDGSWSEPVVADPAEQLDSVSCASSSFCMALDGAGRMLLYDGSAWHEGAHSPAPGFHEVSCASSSFCMAVGDGGRATIYDGAAWSTPTESGLAEARSVSCVSASFCMAVGAFNGGAGEAASYDGSSWSPPSEIGPSWEAGISSVSCGSASFCVAAGNFGDEETYENGKWAAPNRITENGFIRSVSCHGAFCLAAPVEGESVAYRAGTWSGVGEGADSGLPGGVSCASETFCMTAGGFASYYDGSSWSAHVPLGGGGLTGVSCPTSSACTAVDGSGRALSWDGSGWSAPVQIAPGGGLRGVSCTPSGFCAAIGGWRKGFALTLGPGGWGSPGTIDPTGTAESVSCVSASFCVALSARESEGQQRTEAFTWRGSGWSGPAEVSAHSILRSISCVSEAFCVAVGGSEAALFTGGSWQAPAVVAAGSFLRSVSCASAAFCEAVGEHPVNIAEHVAEGVTYDGAGWSEPQEIPAPPDRLALSPGPVSCPTTSFCMAGGAFEAAGATLEAGVWAPWAPLEINDGFTSMSCPAATLCIGVTEEGQAFLYGAAGSPPATGSVPVQTSPPGTAGTGGTAAYTADRALPRLELLGRPRLNRRSGRLTLSFSLPGPGTAEAAAVALHRCRSVKGKRSAACPEPALGYRHAKRKAELAGTYTLTLVPDPAARVELEHGAVLTERVTLVLRSGPTERVRRTLLVRVSLAASHRTGSHG